MIEEIKNKISKGERLKADEAHLLVTILNDVIDGVKCDECDCVTEDVYCYICYLGASESSPNS